MNAKTAGRVYKAVVAVTFVVTGMALSASVLSARVVTMQPVDAGTLRYDHDETRTVTFRNPSYILPLTITPPAATGCACVRVVTPATVIAPRSSADFRVAIEALQVGERTEALKFGARQGFRSKPVYVFVMYRVVR